LGRGGRRRSRRGRKLSVDGSTSRQYHPVIETIELKGDVGSHALEALQLELKRVARRCGLEVNEIRIETVAIGPLRQPL